MELGAARLIATLIEAYALIGVVFAAIFLPRAALRVDPRLVHSPRTVRLLVAPGIAALWPLFARRWLRGSGVPDEHNPHRDRAAAESPR